MAQPAVAPKASRGRLSAQRVFVEVTAQRTATLAQKLAEATGPPPRGSKDTQDETSQRALPPRLTEEASRAATKAAQTLGAARPQAAPGSSHAGATPQRGRRYS